LEHRLLLYAVTSTADSGPGTLRQAILDLNAQNSAQVIEIDLSGNEPAPQKIVLQSPLPTINRPATITSDYPLGVQLSPAPAQAGLFDGLTIHAKTSLFGVQITGFRDGVSVIGGIQSVIGFPATGFGKSNLIFGNARNGISVTGYSAVTITGNRIYDNGAMAIDLGADGPTPNDPVDWDDGPNSLINSPNITSARVRDGYLQVNVDTTDMVMGSGVIDLFFSPANGATGEGRTEIIRTSFGVSSSHGPVLLKLPIPSGITSADAISATYTLDGVTSEFSNPFPVTAPFYVTTTADSGAGSLRQAMIDVNDHPGPDDIYFNLSTSDRTITVLSPLPALVDTTTIDGASQPSYTPDNPIRIVGNAAPSDTDGITLSGGTQSILRGLAITGFRNGVVITGGEGHLIGDNQGNAFSASPAWNYIFRNRGDGIRVLAGLGHTLRYNYNLYNQGLPIDLGGDGANPTDANDADSGPNGLANAPVIDEASNLDGLITIDGALTTMPGASQHIDLYSYPAIDRGASLPTYTNLASYDLNAGASSILPFSYSSSDSRYNTKAPLGQRIVAVATDASGNTSEFSPAATVTLPKYSVVNTNDSGPGSFRQAILDANSTPGANVITIHLPVYDAHVFHIASPLPDITDTVTFDGSFSLAPTGTNTVNFDGLVLACDNSVIPQFGISGFRNGLVVRGNDNQLGSTTDNPYFLPGTVTGNSADGIRIESGVGNRIRGVAAYDNGHLPINLGTDGLTPNDPLDADTGPNQLQNVPELLQAQSQYFGTRLTGRLNSAPNTTYHIEVFYNNTAPAGVAQAKNQDGEFDVTTDASGIASFDQLLHAVGTGTFLTATATDPAGNTSELAAPIAATGPELIVTNTDKTGPGSLYGAIANSGFHTGPDIITFDIPGNGAHRILLDPNTMPVWNVDNLTIDATTQPGYARSPLVELVGAAGSTGGGAALAFNSGNANVIRGLAIGGFGIGIDFGSTGSIEACYIGLAADGSPLPNQIGIRSQGGATIGGTVAAARNVISANTVAGIAVGGAEIIQGNYIGTNPAGNAPIPNGVGIVSSGGENTIGGAVAAARNVISGNTGHGIRLDAFTYYVKIDQFSPNVVQGNYIGVAADGLTPLPNGGDGILADGPAAFIGGILPGQGNIIAYNGGNGVTVAIDPAQLGSGQKTSIRGNSIYNNAKLAIDLANDGITPNDPLDPDTGANTLQNFPVMTAASSDGASTLVEGSLNSLANATFTLDFYTDAPTASQSRTYLGSTTVTTDAAGNATFTASLPTPTNAGQDDTATATSPTSSTSELSTPLFISLPGDANRDRAVDFNDLVLLAQNYNTPGQSCSTGDFTGDGLVDFNDLVKLAQNYNTTLPAPGAAAPTQILYIASAPMPSLASVLAKLDTTPTRPTPTPPAPRQAKPAASPHPKPRSPFSLAPIQRPTPAPIATHPKKRLEILGL
jgi:hypothetical protein